MINGSHFLLYSKHPEADRVLREASDFVRSMRDGLADLRVTTTEIAVHPMEDDAPPQKPMGKLSARRSI